MRDERANPGVDFTLVSSHFCCDMVLEDGGQGRGRGIGD